MQHQPPETNVRLPQTIHQRIQVIRHKLIRHHPLRQVLLTLLITLTHLSCYLERHLRNSLNIQNIVQRQFSSFVRLPPLRQVNYVPEVVRHHPHVVEVLVDNLAHS